MSQTRVTARVEGKESIAVHVVDAHQWHGASGHVYDIPEGLCVRVGDVEFHGSPDDVLTVLDTALTSAQATMDARGEGC
jgi:hypothetical protein